MANQTYRRFWEVFGISCMIAMIAVQATADEFASPEDEAIWADRALNGVSNVIWMHGLLDGYADGLVTQADLELELWQERPAVMAALYNIHGTFTTCFQTDLILMEANEPFGSDASGNPIYFDVSQFLDGSGEVMPGMARQFNAANLANGIMLKSLSDRSMCQAPPRPNNRCWKNVGGIINCDTKRNAAHCELDAFGNPVPGSHQCLQ